MFVCVLADTRRRLTTHSAAVRGRPGGRCVAISLCAPPPPPPPAVELRLRVIHQFKRRRPCPGGSTLRPASATDPHQLTMKDVAGVRDRRSSSCVRVHGETATLKACSQQLNSTPARELRCQQHFLTPALYKLLAWLLTRTNKQTDV